MSSLFPFAASSPFFARTKRKMSGPGVAIALDIEDACGGGANGSIESASSSSGVAGKGDVSRTSSGTKLLSCTSDSFTGSSSSSSGLHAHHGVDVAKTKSWFCALCRSVDVREVLGFACWKVLSLLIVVLAVADWIFFFKFVVEPATPRARVTNGALWSALTLSLFAFRSAVRAKCGADIRALADHLEIFIAVSLAMVFSTNIAFYLHAPASAPLRDLGFMLVPEQAVDSKWRPLSDILTAVMPVLGLLQTLFMTRENRCRVIATFFRVASVAYALRMLTVSLTSLPGPAPHCRPGSGAYMPPQTWIDIVTRVGPMYGQFNSCGDLIFSGHMAYTNSALLLYLRTTDRYFPRLSRLRWTLGAAFLLTLAALCVAGRKHYSVDVVLGIMISTLVYFHFEHSWVPPCVAQSVRTPAAAAAAAATSSAQRMTMYPFGKQPLAMAMTTPYSGSKASDFEVLDDDEQFHAGRESDLLLFHATSARAPSLQQQHHHHQHLSAVDFIC